MKVVLNLGENPSWLRKGRNLGIALKCILEALVEVNQHYLRLHKGVPLLYQSGVRYREESARHAILIMRAAGFSGRVEEFASIPAVMERGWGDCDDLAPWLAAERREVFKEKAHIKVEWKPTRTGRLFHITTRLQDPRTGLIGDSSPTEDPSAKLGMYEPTTAPTKPSPFIPQLR